MNNKSLMTIIIIILLGILTIMVIQMNQRTPAEKLGDSITNTVDQISDDLNNQMEKQE